MLKRTSVADLVGCFFLCPSTLSAFPPPKLMMNKRLITDTDSVSMHCQAPPYVNVFQCYFVIVNTKSTVVFSCMKTVTGSQLLLRSQQTPPAVVQVECFYTVKDRDQNVPSKHSDISSITIKGKSLGGPFNTSVTRRHLGCRFSGNIQKNTQTVFVHFGKLQESHKRPHGLSLPRLELQHQVNKHYMKEISH